MNINKSALVALTLITSGAAQADLSANVGFASDYYYRGIFQATSSASAGLDYESGGFYAGTWAADVKDGLEVDGYFGYGGEVGDFGYGIGFTGYYYTGDFAGPTLDYTIATLTIEKDGFYGKYATFSQDADGDYFELGYGTTVAEIDLGVTLLFNDKNLSGDGSSDEALIFSIGKSFDLN
jgi:uncharacterized protein (TIGR02001 family)